jgi:hypothetical protein
MWSHGRKCCEERHSLIPLDGRADDQDEGQGDLGVPLLGGLREAQTWKGEQKRALRV